MKIFTILRNISVMVALSSQAFGYVAMPGEPNINNARDALVPISSGSSRLFTILVNKSQNDPSLDFENASKLADDDYLCISGDKKVKCNALTYYETTLWSSNSVAAKIELNSNILENLKKDNKKIVFLNRINHGRAGDHLRNDKPFMKVYIDKNGYLNAEFTRLTGGLSQARTSEPIPTDEPVYIQANEMGEVYEVGWKGLVSNKTSFGKNGHQVSPIDSDQNANPKPWVELGLDSNEQDDLDMNDVYNGLKVHSLLNVKDYFWSYKVDMFFYINKNTTTMPVHQNNTQLNLDMNLVYKILNDLRNPDQNDSNLNFKNDTLRVYSVPGTGIVADIREKQ